MSDEEHELEMWRQRYRAYEHTDRIERQFAAGVAIVVVFAAVVNIVLSLTGWDKYIP